MEQFQVHNLSIVHLEGYTNLISMSVKHSFDAHLMDHIINSYHQYLNNGRLHNQDIHRRISLYLVLYIIWTCTIFYHFGFIFGNLDTFSKNRLLLVSTYRYNYHVCTIFNRVILLYMLDNIHIDLLTWASILGRMNLVHILYHYSRL